MLSWCEKQTSANRCDFLTSFPFFLFLEFLFLVWEKVSIFMLPSFLMTQLSYYCKIKSRIIETQLGWWFVSIFYFLF